MENPTVKLSEFVAFFPEVELPLTLTDDLSHDFMSMNEPLPQIAIEEYIIPHEEEGEVNEYTEYVPCFRIPKTNQKIVGLVYWKVGLLTYEYFLITFGINGKFIAKRTIAGTKVFGETLVHTVATISENHIIHVVEGYVEARKNLEAAASRFFNFELTGLGEIVPVQAN
jgi:hypothetical protein